MTWIGYFRPILTSSGILPLILALTWSRQTRLAATWAPILGFISGLAVWLATAQTMYGSITLATTMKECPSLYGSIAACCSPALYSLLLSAYRPSTFDWREFLRITAVTQSEPTPVTAVTTIPRSSTTDTAPPSPNEKSHTKSATTTTTETDDLIHPLDKPTLAHLARWYRIAWVTFAVLVLLTFVAWPLPLYRDYIFGRAFFAGWTTVAIVWQFFAFGAVVVYPIYDGRWEIWRGARGVMGSVGGWLKGGK